MAVPMMALKDNTFMAGGDRNRSRAGVGASDRGAAGFCNPFISTPSTLFSRTLLVTFLLMTFNVNVCQVVQAATSASASASASANAAIRAERRPRADLERSDGSSIHHYGE
ncbi:G2/mitotic-specific cyclin (Clb3), putative [Anopheles sinensis]|uniref:G2/mitotic-specific cyclin (Clb3), putative n=1 Tax=Anopheles sinensis TaxID=74873 RepID=A0A084W0B7_ANOSI|nr:G2/mitotic-specific cyclin (Clb3), putative [Anopheles sinensis]